MVGLAENKANSAQLELEAGAELGNFCHSRVTWSLTQFLENPAIYGRFLKCPVNCGPWQLYEPIFAWIELWALAVLWTRF